MKTRKSTAFWTVVWFSAVCVAVTAWRAPEALIQVIPATLTAVVAAGATYQGTNVLDNWQRSANYRSELDKNGGS